VGDDALGGDRANAFDQAGAQVLADVFDRGRIEGGVPGELELPSVLGMGGPEAFQADAFPGLGRSRGTDDGHRLVVVAPGLEPGDGVPGVFGLEGDALEDACEGVGHGKRDVVDVR